MSEPDSPASKVNKMFYQVSMMLADPYVLNVLLRMGYNKRDLDKIANQLAQMAHHFRGSK